MDKKTITLPIKIIIIGCLIGLVVAGIGGFKQFDAKRINKERADTALKESQEKIDAAEKRLTEIETELSTLESDYEVKSQECASMNMRDTNWFADHSKCQREATNIRTQISELESEQFKLKNDDYTVYYQLVKPMSYQIFYIIGGSIAVLALLGSFIIYLVKGKKTY